MSKIVSDSDLTRKAKGFIDSADADGLCHIIGIMFGVICEFDEETGEYELSPTDDYCDAFGSLE